MPKDNFQVTAPTDAHVPMPDLKIGDLVIVDAGKKGIDIVTAGSDNLQAWFNNKGLKALQKWLKKRGDYNG
jgi:hypothetical protein